MRTPLYTRLLRNRRRLRRCTYSTISIAGMIPFAWVSIAVDRQGRERGRYTVYLN